MKNKKVEASKKILIFCDTLLTLTIIATFVALFMNIEVSSVVSMVVSLSGLTAAAHSFYYWKAKAENLQKYNQLDKLDMSNDEIEDYMN